MAGSKSDYLENKILDHNTGKTSFTKPTAYVALFTVAPTDAGGGTEVSGSAYTRVTTAAADWNAAASGSTSNANVLTFPTPTGSWGTVVAFATFDAVSAGNMLYWGTLTSSQVVSTGNVVSFAAGALVITED